MNDQKNDSWVGVAVVVLVAIAFALFGDANEATECDTNCPLLHAIHGEEVPQMNLPPELRRRNRDGGSCVHVSTEMLMEWQGQHELADWWASQYKGGENSSRLHKRLEAAGVRYAYTIGGGDREFLEWAIRTRRGAGITYWPNHAVCLVGLDESTAYVLDNNRVDRIIEIPREEFFRRWRGYGGWAWTIVYDPPPPVPYTRLARRVP